MGALLGIIGMLAALAGIVMFFIALVRKRGWGVLRSLTLFGVGLIMFIVGIAISPGEAPETISPATTPPPETPPPSEVGKSRLNPVPFGSSLTYRDERVTVVNSKRLSEIGWSTPDAGSIYLVVNIRVDFLGDPTEKRQYLSTSNFRVVGSGGRIYDAEWLVETDTPLKSGEFYGGATTSGDLVYEIDEQETDLALIWNCGLGVDRYFEIP